ASLNRAFSPYGRVEQAKLLFDKGCAFVKMPDQKQCEAAVLATYGRLTIGGKRLNVSFAKRAATGPMPSRPGAPAQAPQAVSQVDRAAQLKVQRRQRASVSKRAISYRSLNDRDLSLME
ncbi:hypothetical protein KIPB_013295, partial [Kipferlia bialata]